MERTSAFRFLLAGSFHRRLLKLLLFGGLLLRSAAVFFDHLEGLRGVFFSYQDADPAHRQDIRRVFVFAELLVDPSRIQ